MLEVELKKIQFDGENYIKSHHINLDTNLECVIVFTSKDEKLQELLYTKILDVCIDRIHPKNVYKDFSNALESVNAFLSSWQHGEDKIKGFSAVIGIYSKKTFYFSTVGKASCYLYNSHNDIIEITDKNDISKDFSFISSGDVADGESLILSTTRLLSILSKDDLVDSFAFGGITQAADNVESILLKEHSGKNIALSILQKKAIAKQGESNKNREKLKYFCYRCLDNALIKKGLSRVYVLRDMIMEKSKGTQQILLGVGVLLLTYFLYTVIAGFSSVALQSGGVDTAREDLQQAQSYVITAAENMGDEDVFLYNIQQAEELLSGVKEKNLFLGDTQMLERDMSLLKKKINGVELFTPSTENTIYSFNETEQVVDVLELSGKSYVITKDSVIGPIYGTETPQKTIFEELGDDDAFVSGTSQDSDAIIVTQSGKVVRFTQNNAFSFVDVLNQESWSKSPVIDSYGRNIYLLGDNQNQVLMHRSSTDKYESGIGYLKDEDSIATGRILDIAIDGGIYILKLDGTMLKLFRNPSYRLESLVLNKLPKNYDFSNLDGDKLPSIQTQANLKYVYMYLDNKILIFEPNTLRFQDVKSLTYIGQIEGQDIAIESFYVKNDGEIFVASEKGFYKMEFEVDGEDNLLIK